MYADLALLIDGKFLGGEGRVSVPVLNPATGRTLARLPHASVNDLDHALDAAARGFALWSARSAYDRSLILRRAAGIIRDRKDPIARVLTLEQGKPLPESVSEVVYAADVIDWCAEEGRRTYGRVIPGRSCEVQYLTVAEPVGPVAAFTPWNFPALTPARKIGGALGAGCSLILKASEETPGTAIEIARAFVEAGLPAGVLNLVFGVPAEISAHLIASPVIRKVSFTGSTPVGKQLLKLAAEGVKRTTMELGGHAPVVIFDDADLERTVDTAARGKFRNAGQVCISPTRFYVQEALHQRFVERFTAAAEGLRLGDGLEAGVTMGPLANPRRVEAMERLVADALSRGAKLKAGGVRRGNEGFFFAPTVLTEVPDDARIMTEEPFGPVVPVVPFKSFEEVVARANSLPFGLAAYAFTQSSRRSAEIGRALKAGMVGINTMAISTPETPFGGVKESGHGHEGGLEGLQGYLDLKLIATA